MATAPGRSHPTKSATAFRTISEVSDELDVPQHVLRFWETKFNQVKPLKRGGGRRYYRPEDLAVLRGIRKLLYTDGYTIRGVQRLLKQGGVKAFLEDAGAAADSGPVRPGGLARDSAGDAGSTSPADRRELKAIMDELVALREMLPRPEK
ncbi:MAG: MerR family transcriptional regulator [Alphaproteobacteria bacterium]|nr:MerR family transcriptional regulator [Alphaproteobacteria bacterium]